MPDCPRDSAKLWEYARNVGIDSRGAKGPSPIQSAHDVSFDLINCTTVCARLAAYSKRMFLRVNEKRHA